MFIFFSRTCAYSDYSKQLLISLAHLDFRQKKKQTLLVFIRAFELLIERNYFVFVNQSVDLFFLLHFISSVQLNFFLSDINRYLQIDENKL